MLAAYPCLTPLGRQHKVSRHPANGRHLQTLEPSRLLGNPAQAFAPLKLLKLDRPESRLVVTIQTGSFDVVVAPKVWRDGGPGQRVGAPRVVVLELPAKKIAGPRHRVQITRNEVLKRTWVHAVLRAIFFGRLSDLLCIRTRDPVLEKCVPEYEQEDDKWDGGKYK